MNSEHPTINSQSTCTAVKKNGQLCGAKARFYNPFTKECNCVRHNKLSPDQANRVKSDVLCYYGKDGLPLHDIDTYFETLEPDLIGEEAIKTLKGYINIRVGTPLLFESIPLVFMSKIQGFGDNFDRKSLAKCLKDSIEYLLSRRDIYVIQDDVDIYNLRLMSIRYDMYYGHFIAIMKTM